MKAKFVVGSKVRFTSRVCKDATIGLRHRSRTIVDAFYDDVDQCVYYRLGIRGDHRCELGFGFRSYMLYSANGRGHIVGRPRIHKRRKNRKLPSCASGQNLGHDTPKLILQHLGTANF